MIDLRRITRTESYIEADYYPEGSEEKGYVKIDLDGNVIEQIEAPYDEGMGWYCKKACAKLRDFIDAEEVPERYIIVWC